MTDCIDWTDPCARADALRKAYYSLVTGGQEVEIRTRSLDADEMVRFQPGNLETLRTELTAAEIDCAATQAAAAGPTLPKRFAIACRQKRRRGHPFFRGFE